MGHILIDIFFATINAFLKCFGSVACGTAFEENVFLKFFCRRSNHVDIIAQYMNIVSNVV